MIFPKKYKEIENICQEYGIRRLHLFGSTVNGTPGPESDIDILIEFPEDNAPGLFLLGEIQQELSEVFNRPVDLKTPGFFSEKERDEILKNSRVEYETA